MIGDFIEDYFSDIFSAFAKKHGLYCDKKGPRPLVRGHKVDLRWQDSDGNEHKLDYVFEIGGSEAQLGKPVAFIELAWRRYTKHSRNKTGEIEGALLPLRNTYYTTCRFIGMITAGQYSKGGLDQLRSHGIRVLHIPFGAITDAFASKGVDLRYPENAPNEVKRAVIAKWQELSDTELAEVKAALGKSVRGELKSFMADLRSSLSRAIESILVVSLFGEKFEYASVKECIDALNTYTPVANDRLGHRKFEMYILFKNKNRVEGSFGTKQEALDFLRLFE